jgi:hypothetical protein
MSIEPIRQNAVKNGDEDPGARIAVILDLLNMVTS